MQANFEDDPDASSIMELGVAYLWLKDYAAAWHHFHSANHRQPLYAANFYGMAGVAKWCMNEPNDAVSQWAMGIRCKYADAAGALRFH